jgi:16S rRNA processing protein RimM
VIRLDCEAPRGALLELPADELPPPGEDEYYAFQLVGLAVEEEGGRRLGAVAAVAPGVANDVLELDSGVALPLVEDVVRSIDLAARRIVVAPGFAD